jgi:DNA-binding response OmpR family regulator
LAGWGLSISRASALDALTLLKSNAYDVLISDLDMPGIDGSSFSGKCAVDLNALKSERSPQADITGQRANGVLCKPALTLLSKSR